MGLYCHVTSGDQRSYGQTHTLAIEKKEYSKYRPDAHDAGIIS